MNNCNSKSIKMTFNPNKACLVTEDAALEACLVTEGASLEACLVTEGITINDNLVAKKSTDNSITSLEQQNKCHSSRNECMRAMNENKKSNNESSSARIDVVADIGPSYDSDTVTKVHHSNNNTFENVFAHGIQNHEQPKFYPDTYMVNENNGDIIFDIPNMDSDKYKEEHDYVDSEQQHAFFASLINNLKCDVEKCNKVNHEAQQANALLISKLVRYMEKEKHSAKDKIIASEYSKKIKLLNDKISNLKSQACQKYKTFIRENEKFDEYVQLLLKGNINLK
nr:hypothetical protein [Tanacetum cinerariifolium]